MASLSEVEAILITAAVAATLAAWGVVTQRLVSRRLTTIQHLTATAADSDMIEARKTFNALSEPGGKLSLYSKPSDLSDDETDDLRLVLNDYENQSVAVQFGIYDLSMIKLLSRGTIIRDWSRAAPFVYKLRAELDNPNIYYEFEMLADWVQDRRKPKRRIWTRLWF